ncbi:MAG: amidohydrolase family protein [Pseudomonadota bacterium]
MFKKKTKTLIIWVASFFIVSSALSLWIMDYKIDQVWGEHTKVVNPEPFRKPQQAFAIVNVSVLSADGDSMRPNHTVLIEDGLITDVNSGLNLPTGINVIDGTGKYLIPGLIDSHVHLWQSPNDLLLYIANGVTHIREMNGSDEHLTWKAEIESGRPGPEMFVTSRRHNSSSGTAGLFERWTAKINPVDDTDDIESHVQQMMEKGYDAVKIYTLLKKRHFQAFNKAALKLDVQLLGHIPMEMTLDEIWQSELKELAHTEELVKALAREFAEFNSETSEEFLQFVHKRSADIVIHLLKNDVAVVSTLSLMESIAPQKLDVADALRAVELEYVNPGIAEALHPSVPIMGWLPDVNIYRLPYNYPQEKIPGNQTYWKAYAQANRILLKAMANKGVKVLAGTDANVPVMVPGFSLHEELVSLTQAGFSEAQALRSATSTPAVWMKVKSGKVLAGYQADLVLLHANPLKDINHTRTVDTVISNGRQYNRTDLDSMLSSVKSAN